MIVKIISCQTPVTKIYDRFYAKQGLIDRDPTQVVQSWKALKQVKVSIRVDNYYPLFLEYPYVPAITYCAIYNMFIITIVKYSIVAICIVCTTVHWTIKQLLKMIYS